ncbi:17-beta-hydroxysteroid dehydrogenase 13-like [Sipha flava]|uniref:17-beta-hydroxysteroid dehydrogenase 13-like n=1 Tax=Sipha flava TaxID=143950 RepID=A0A8B8FG25_9HEMI|nr:17-beta-hydroxysteroid dehydrogenase 13-like [Sipha flava]
MGLVHKLLSVFFKEYLIPAQPISFCFEVLLCVILNIPKIIVSMILYVYFPAEPKSVQGKVILITGTARGNGRELALQFHRLGAKIACVDKDGAGNDETVERIRAEGGVAEGFVADITDRRQVMDMHAAVGRLMGPVDVLVNNAGVVKNTLFADPEVDDVITDIVNTNLLGQIWVIREILPSMLERNTGHIVTISSMTSFQGLEFHFAYSATKFAVNGMMESLTKELKLMKSDVITTTVCPYFIANCPRNSSNRILRFPEIPVEDACELIIEGILRNERIFTVPDNSFYPLQFIKFLPEDVQDMFRDVYFTNIKLTPKEENIIDKYTIFTETSNNQAFSFNACMKMGSLPD